MEVLYIQAGIRTFFFERVSKQRKLLHDVRVMFRNTENHSITSPAGSK